MKKNKTALVFFAFIFVLGSLALCIKVVDFKTEQLKAENEIDWSECSDEVKLEIGNHFFAFPRARTYPDVKFYLTDHSGKYPCNEILKTKSVAFRPDAFLGRNPGLLRISLYASAKQKDGYTHWEVERKLKEQGLSLKDLPIQDGFYSFEYSKNQFLLISADPQFTSFRNNPVTLYCVVRSKDEQYLECSLFRYFQNGIDVSALNIATNIYPLSEMRKFHHQLADAANRFLTHTPVSNNFKEKN